MPDPKFTYDDAAPIKGAVLREEHIEYGFIGTLQRLKYEYCADITDRATLEQKFREKFEALNRVFSPPAEGDPDVKQIQEDLPQEMDNHGIRPLPDLETKFVVSNFALAA